MAGKGQGRGMAWHGSVWQGRGRVGVWLGMVAYGRVGAE